MKAIKVTQQLKNDNPSLFLNYEVGKITRINIPNVFVRDGKKILGYNFSDEQQSIDGFKEVVTPSYDKDNQRLGNLIEDANMFTYEVVELTESEIEARLPETISKLAFKKALLLNHGIKESQVLEFINNIPDEMQREVLLLEWQEADFFEREHDAFVNFSSQFGLSIDDINKIFKDYA